MRHAVITGAFSNTGRATARELQRRGWRVSTLTNREPPEDSRIEAHALRFDRDHLLNAFHGADAFINTYWIRFPHGKVTFKTAIENSKMLFECATQAGVDRIVNVSVSNARGNTGLAYYDGKAQVDSALKEIAKSYGIVRPTLIVGPDDVLTNNIAWFVRRMPVFGLPVGSGYRLQPVTLDDTARIIADTVESSAPVDVDAAGPETFSFREYVELVAQATNSKIRFVKLPRQLIVASLKLFNPFLHDTVLTGEELAGLRLNLLTTHDDPLGKETVTDWLLTKGKDFGSEYCNDTTQRFAHSH